MATTLNSSGVTFPDATTQTTAAGAVNTSTVLAAFSGTTSLAVGSYGVNGQGRTVGSTYAGSSLGLSTGTWRCMSSSTYFNVFTVCGGGSSFYTYVASYLRIS